MDKLPMPSGAITIKYVLSRGVFQMYSGNRYMYGCSGPDYRDACRDMVHQYDVPEEAQATVYGFKEPFRINIHQESE